MSKKNFKFQPIHGIQLDKFKNHSYEEALKTNNFSKIKDLCEKDSRNKEVILNELFHLIEKNCTDKNNENDKIIIIEKLRQSKISIINDSIKKLLLDSGADINYKINNKEISILSLQNKILTIKDLKFLINIKFKFKLESKIENENKKLYVQYNWLNSIKENTLELLFRYITKKNKIEIINTIIYEQNSKLFKMIIPFIDFTDYDINVKDERCVPLFINSIYEMNEVIVNYFINHVINNKLDLHKNIDDYTFRDLLKAAIEKENEVIVDYLLDYNKFLNFDIYGNWNNPLIHAINKKSLLMVECLIKHKIDVNRDDRRFTPLTIAITYRNMPIIKYLVTHDADVNNNVYYICNTPLIHAICFRNIEIVKYLVDHGANVNQRGRQGLNPLTYAKMRNNQEIINYLIEKNAME
ncbi:ankyrin repeat-containing domain protein [Neocallimastix lanati (nom. inval.)]|nr:ankyrin repeat-containing domain protein [Neocallimastix sp. JGI-2020a]